MRNSIEIYRKAIFRASTASASIRFDEKFEKLAAHACFLMLAVRCLVRDK
jgi:hypothetical protein